MPLFCSRKIGADGAEHRERPLQVGLDHRIPLGLGHVEEHAFAEDAGDADHAVDAAEGLDRLVDDRRAAVHRRDRLRVGGGASTGGDDLGDDPVGHLTGGLVAVDAHAVVVHDDRGALGRAGQCNRAADPASCSRYRNDLAVERAHVCLLPFVVSYAGGTIPAYAGFP